MKKKSYRIVFDEETERFLTDYKKIYGTPVQKFVENAVFEKMVRFEAELLLKSKL